MAIVRNKNYKPQLKRLLAQYRDQAYKTHTKKTFSSEKK